MKKHFSFTLVELLGAMALIVILAGIAFSGYSYAMNKAKESATTSTIKQIETALNAAKIKAGYVPASSSYAVIKFTVDSADLLEKIEFGSTELSASKNKKLFAEFKKIIDFEAIRQNLDNDSELADGFGGKIYYAFPGKINKTGFDLVSAGADGKFAKEDSGKPHNSSARSDYYDGNERIVDDISNF
jgi:type II secretory pathway pseudopilin PulG